MTTQFPTRHQVDRAAPLEFPERAPVRQDLTLTVKARVNGFDVDICFSGQLEQLDAITKRLAALGATPTAAAPAAAPVSPIGEKPRKPAQRLEPAYQADGTPCCPIHKKPLSEGRYGLYCPSKAQGEHANDKGYCNLKFAE